MSLFLGPMCAHIPGHKELSDKGEAQRLRPEKNVYIPLFAGNGGTVEILVNEGDHVDIGTRLANTKSAFPVPLYSSVSGTYTGTVKMPHNSMRPQQHMVIELDETQTRIQSFEPMNPETASHEEMVERIKEAGIIGQGGAGFPTYVKYSTKDPIDTVLVNAVECEPYITADYKQVMDHPAEMVRGCVIAQKISGAKQVIVCIKKSHPDLIEVVNAEIKNQNVGSFVRTEAVPDVYPMGAERTLIRTVLKREYNRLPSECGVIVNNCGTLICVANAFDKGYTLAEKYVTVSGEAIAQPKNVIVPVGMQVSEILPAAGGIVSGLQECFLISGGPMMGKTMVNDQWVIDRANNAITVLKNETLPNMTCMRCGQCVSHCPIGLQPVRIAQAVKANDTVEMEKRGAMLCVECGLCTYVCPSHIQVTENVRKAKRTLAMKNRKK